VNEFVKDAIFKLPIGRDRITVLVDGFHFSEELNKKAKTKGIKMIPTNFTGGAKNSNCDKLEIDGIPSILHRRYKIDHLSVRGLYV